MWRNVCALTRRERALALEIAIASLGVELGLRLLTPQRLLMIIRRHRRIRGTADAARAQLAELQRLTAAVLRRSPFRMTCLKQTLILCALLHRRGLPADLKIGLTKHGEALQAHAWIEHEGCVLLDEPDVAQRFLSIVSLASMA